MANLIVYGTKYGSVQGCAERLKKELNDDTVLLNLKKEKADDVDISSYDTIIIGGSIYVGRIQKEVSAFCEKHSDTLLKKKIGLFICCMEEGKKANEQLISMFDQKLLDHAVIKEVFGGELDMAKLGFIHKMMMKIVSQSDENKKEMTNKKEKTSSIDYNKIIDFAKTIKEA
ncbi:menaquinone-dependent protoporphyrinogen oxidase [Natranaerovirga hydrolytica]|uniref:Menaquinone-dependent protoporphyrinogen oxidase n=1 Tax=Natranaerovirga hydrolytica TaxID=680378 RepID=A0A4R1MQM6_9FIRM|nr:flavodoxin domain-containing protein [Natranaerovirga hydrolytica]TCK92839.1 menaquinone-dependent protoporphyrinogen oxidase [Natranaerovirga hydrolytica]